MTIALYAEKIAENTRKIEQLTKNIKRDTAKRKKLLEDNAHLSYLAICEKYNCEGQDLLDILSREHQQAKQLKANSMSEDDIVFYDKQDSNDDDDRDDENA